MIRETNLTVAVVLVLVLSVTLAGCAGLSGTDSDPADGGAGDPADEGSAGGNSDDSNDSNDSNDPDDSDPTEPSDDTSDGSSDGSSAGDSPGDDSSGGDSSDDSSGTDSPGEDSSDSGSSDDSSSDGDSSGGDSSGDEPGGDSPYSGAPIDDDTPDPATFDGRALSSGETLEGEVGEDEYTWYRLQTADGGELSTGDGLFVELTLTGEDADEQAVGIYLYDSNGDQYGTSLDGEAFESNWAEGSSAVEADQAETDGYYWVAVVGSDDLPESAPYELAFAREDVGENDPTTDEPLADGETVTDRHATYAEDTYALELDAGETVTLDFEFDVESEKYGASVNVYRPDGELLVDAVHGPGDELATTSFEVETAGTYVVSIEDGLVGQHDYYGKATYELTVSVDETTEADD